MQFIFFLIPIQMFYDKIFLIKHKIHNNKGNLNFKFYYCSFFDTTASYLSIKIFNKGIFFFLNRNY